ncbi:MAG: thermonuclease family protein [Ignavibacteria bacterium]|nr:thermonuclease family protein [Ignavibacteria bacterium]
MFGLSRKLISSAFTAIFILMLVVYVVYNKYKDESGDNPRTNKSSELLTVKRVVDGDTFLLSDGERVRLLAIDTPEKFESKKLDKDAESSGKDKKTIKKLGQLASDYVKNLVEGKKVRLEKEPNYEDKDKYGRLLRYVYLEDGTCVNAKIISDGYGQVYESYPVSKTNEFRKLQREARENGRGLWGNIEGLEQFK